MLTLAQIRTRDNTTTSFYYLSGHGSMHKTENFSSFIRPSLPNFPTRSITPMALPTSPGPFSFIYHGPRKSLERKRFNNVSTLFLHFICHLLPGHSCLRSTDTCHKRTLRYQSRPCLKKTLAIKIDRTNCSVKISFDPLWNLNVIWRYGSQLQRNQFFTDKKNELVRKWHSLHHWPLCSPNGVSQVFVPARHSQAVWPGTDQSGSQLHTPKCSRDSPNTEIMSWEHL